MGCMLRTWTGGVVNWHLQTRSSRWAIAMRGSGGSEGLCSGLEPIYCGCCLRGSGSRETGPGGRRPITHACAGRGQVVAALVLSLPESAAKEEEGTNVGSKKWRERFSHTK